MQVENEVATLRWELFNFCLEINEQISNSEEGMVRDALRYRYKRVAKAKWACKRYLRRQIPMEKLLQQLDSTLLNGAFVSRIQRAILQEQIAAEQDMVTKFDGFSIREKVSLISFAPGVNFFFSSRVQFSSYLRY